MCIRDRYEGTPEQWDEAQTIMGNLLDKLGISYKVGIDEAAFYGPKLDIQIKNVHGKEDTLITIQIDMLLAKKFGMEYTDRDGTQATPYIIHRSSLGCYERTLALLLEKYAGALPLWMAPTQIRILPIGDGQLDAAQALFDRCSALGIRVEVDSRNEKIGYKIREAQLQKIPYMLVIGEKEAAAGTVSVRSRKNGDEGVMEPEAFLSRVTEEIETKAK